LRCGLLAASFFYASIGCAAEVVLDTIGLWRMYHVLSPPVVLVQGRPKTIEREAHLNWTTAAPPVGWMQPDFDDGDWVRGPARRACQTPYLERLCLRGKFAVENPSAVRDLKLTVRYHGGVTVWVNGAELTRRHLVPAADGKSVASAEPYPAEAFSNAQGKPLPSPEKLSASDADLQRRLALRLREITDVAIPASMLRRGVNVIAIEIVRAPYDAVHWVENRTFRPDQVPYQISWYTCEILQVRLAASDKSGLTPNVVRPPGFQVWNSPLLAGDFDLDFGDPNEPLRPLRIIGARNGAFSGKVMVGSTRPIRNLSATVSDLRSRSGDTIPANAVQVRYAMPWRTEQFHPQYLSGSRVSPYPAPASALAALHEAPSAEIKVAMPGEPRNCLQLPGQPKPEGGAVVGVWATVRVPAAARPGDYEGVLRIRAAGEKETPLSIQLRVADWTIPDPADWRNWTEFLQSPDTLALEYGVKPWSEEHFALIGKSLRLLGEAGNRVLTIPLICGTHYGHEETMVRWRDRGGGNYDWDFTVMDRYLDTAERSMGRPAIVAFYVWDVFLIPADGGGGNWGKDDTDARGRETRHQRVAEALRDQLGKGPRVSMLQADGRSVKPFELPVYENPASKAIWKALFDQLRERMRQRGLEQTMMLGVMSDGVPSRAQCAFFNEVSGGLPWVSHSHTMFPKVDGKYKIYGSTEIGFQALNHRFWITDPVQENRRGWMLTDRLINAPAVSGYDSYPATSWKHIVEYTLTAGFNGVRLKGDMWAVLKDRAGRRIGTISDRYPEASWRNLNMPMSALAPGPDGPVATTRLQVYREGLQECEARIFLENALLQHRGRLGAEAREYEEAVNQRTLMIWKGVHHHQLDTPVNFQWYAGVAGHIWFLGSRPEERTEQLFALAGKAARTLNLPYVPTRPSPSPPPRPAPRASGSPRG